MKLSMALNYGNDKLGALAQIVEYERAGLDMVWVAEAYSTDAPSVMGYLAAITKKVQIGSGILPIYTRTPALLAMTAAGVDELSGGRAILGLGASGPQVIEGWHGVPYDKPIARTREIMEICRMVWRRERLVHEGLYTIPLPPEQGTGLGKPLKLINHLDRGTIPIYVAALGEKNVALAAEAADGWLPIFFAPDRANEVFGASLAEGLAKRPPELGTLEIVAGGLLAIGDDVDHLLDLARPMLALYIGGMGARGKNFYNDLAKRYGYEEAATTIQDLYLDGHKAEAAAAIPEDFLRSINLVGSRNEVKERVEAFKEAGVTALSVTPVGPEPMKCFEEIRQIADEVG
ncbi:MAG: LLM class F420-dependent oxidoreductase [Acidimicrobiales bacterium]